MDIIGFSSFEEFLPLFVYIHFLLFLLFFFSFASNIVNLLVSNFIDLNSPYDLYCDWFPRMTVLMVGHSVSVFNQIHLNGRLLNGKRFALP